MHTGKVEWPTLSFVPRKGECIMVHPNWKDYCYNKKIPPRLHVSQVYYHEDKVEIDLWYSETDYKLYGAEKLMEIY